MFDFNPANIQMYVRPSWEELEELVSRMKVYAKDNLVDPKMVMQEAVKDGDVKTEMYGPMLRISGKNPFKGIEQYNKFVYLGDHPFQLCYYEMFIDEVGRVAQLTVVDNLQNPIEVELKHGFIDMFLDWSRRDDIQVMKTPDNVLVVLQKVNDEQQTVH